MVVKDICDIIERHAPLNTALDFDNVGLLIGDYGAEVTGVLVTVDVTRDALDTAIQCGANTIVAHHPIIFNAIKRITAGDYVSDITLEAVRRGINIYACHTNADNASDGLNYSLIKLLGADNIEILCTDGTGCSGDIACGIDELVSKVKKTVKGIIKAYIPATIEQVRKIALITGCGGRDAQIAKRVFEIGADCFITAEIAHNIRLEFIDKGIGLIEFGHYESERIFIDVAKRWLADASVEIYSEYNYNFDN